MHFINKFTCNKTIGATVDMIQNTTWETHHTHTNGNKVYSCDTGIFAENQGRRLQVFRDNIMLEIRISSENFSKHLRLTKDNPLSTSRAYIKIITFKYENGITSTERSEKYTNKISSDIVKKFLKQN